MKLVVSVDVVALDWLVLMLDGLSNILRPGEEVWRDQVIITRARVQVARGLQTRNADPFKVALGIVFDEVTTLIDQRNRGYVTLLTGGFTVN